MDRKLQEAGIKGPKYIGGREVGIAEYPNHRYNNTESRKSKPQLPNLKNVPVMKAG